VRAVVELNGTSWSDTAEQLLFERLTERLGGMQIYLPYESRYEKECRNQNIKGRI